jgi:hypothetical protein
MGSTMAIESFLKNIASQWFDVASAAIVRTVESNPNEQFYVAGFWLFYVDYTVIRAPCFAMNFESHVANSEYGEEIRWSPPNWHFDVVEGSTDAMSSMYDVLTEDLAGKDDSIWDAIIEEHKQAMARVSHRLTTAVRNRSGSFSKLRTSTDFLCGIFDEREGEKECNRLVALSVASDDIAKLNIPFVDQ